VPDIDTTHKPFDAPGLKKSAAGTGYELQPNVRGSTLGDSVLFKMWL